VVSVFLLFLGFSISLNAAQETWGGDVYALKFVKIGVLFADEIKNNPGCSLKKRSIP